MRFIKPFIIAFFLFGSVFTQSNRIDNSVTEAAPEELTIQYVANEGILIKSGSTKVLLDAIHRRYKTEYAFTPDAILEKIEAARFPYGDINLILVSHNHRDHFDPDSVAMSLVNNPKTMLVSSGQVIEEVLAAKKALDATMKPSENDFGKQLVTIKYGLKNVESYELNGVKIRFLSFLHANSKLPAYKDIQNFGHLIEIGGKKILHIGDADMFAENFASFNLKDENLDVVLVPYWFVLSKEGRDILRNQLKAKTIVAVHVPPQDQSETLRSLLDAMPSAVVFSQTGEMLNY